MQSDIEIARRASLRPILEIAEERFGLERKSLIPYGHHKAKLPLDLLHQDKPDGKLILVTAITPTPAGEGKTTTSVGLADGLNRIGKNAAVALREPSLGPVFGMKGGGRRRRSCASRPHGRHQPAFHGGFSRHFLGAQFAVRHRRQPYPPRQRPPAGQSADNLAAGWWT